ncbi:MAG: hypothetical protein ACWGOX_14390 [Desulforhopalus sp.]
MLEFSKQVFDNTTSAKLSDRIFLKYDGWFPWPFPRMAEENNEPFNESYQYVIQVEDPYKNTMVDWFTSLMKMLDKKLQVING